ncbi:MAG: Crp/Fnr family transcriptional regulator [Allosphingosinicella sp.]
MGLSDPTALQPFLDKLISRSTLGPAECEAILGLSAHPAQIQTNRDFVRLGERVNHASFVLAGLVGQFGQNREGSRQITAVHIPSDMVDLHSIVAPDACSALQALSVTTILRVPHDALRLVAARFPAIAEAFWRECVVDAAVLAEWVVNVGRRDSRTRLAHLLCEIACRASGSVRTSAFTVPFPATQTHIADMLGLTPVHVNRTLQVLRKEGVVEVHSGLIEVRDWDRLVGIGDFDAGYLRLAKAANENAIPVKVAGSAGEQSPRAGG